MAVYSLRWNGRRAARVVRACSISLPASPRSPPRAIDERGAPRLLGVEIEFGGVDCAAAAALVQRLFGGRIDLQDRYRYTVAETEYGAFTVELDSRYAHVDTGPGDGQADLWEEIGLSVREELASAFADVASTWLPVEIVTPPVPIDRLPDLDRLVPALRAAGAEGTDDGLIYAFATQFNPGAPSLSAYSLLRHLKAFMLLSGSLRRRIGLDLARRLLPVTNPFSRDYAAKVADPAYQPEMEQLIDDYIADNPSQNRELDMLPVFARVDCARVFERLRDVKVKPRPAFHYRLPDTRLSDPAWGLVAEWNRWVEVEYLANDEPAQHELGRAFVDLCSPGFPAAAAGKPDPWLQVVDAWRCERIPGAR